MGKLHTSDVESRLRSSMDNIDSEISILSTKSSIFLTPKLLFKENEKAYAPHAFSIGPLHHGKPDLTYTEKIKLQYTRDLIRRVSERNGTILKDLVEEIASIEEEARQCYAVPLRFTREEFVEILLVDGCFLIELFRKKLGGSPVPRDDPVMKRAYLYHMDDLYLLENQIPWLVLDRLFRKTTLHAHQESLTELVINLCVRRLEMRRRPTVEPRILNQSKHLIELWRSLLVAELPSRHTYNWDLIPSASRLVEAGVKFEKGSDSDRLLDITFSNGVLKIPHFVFHESTERIYRNLVSFEQCYHSCNPIFTSYVLFLEKLINTPKDIDILSENGIIKMWLNPQEAVKVFNDLCNDACLLEFYYGDVCKDVNEYCNKRWPRWRAIYV